MRTAKQIIGEDLFTQLVFEGFAVVPADPTPEAVGAWWRCKNYGGSDYEAYRALVAVASGDAKPEDFWNAGLK